MRIHHYIYTVLLLLLASCSHIDEADRLIYVAPADVNCAVLIEDFTGQRCVNCPAATVEIEKLQEQYGRENVIAVGIHSGPFGHRTTMSSPRMPLTTETGDAYYRHWGVESQPGTMVNRTGGIIYDPSQYAAAVHAALQKPTPLTLHISTVTTADGQLTVTVEALSAEALSGKLQVWLTEDNITGTQYMPDGSSNAAYVHQHVFRTSLTADLLGDTFTVSATEPATATYSTTLDDTWKTADLNIVAFVYNDTDGVVQATTRAVQTTE